MGAGSGEQGRWEEGKGTGKRDLRKLALVIGGCLGGAVIRGAQLGELFRLLVQLGHERISFLVQCREHLVAQATPS